MDLSMITTISNTFLYHIDAKNEFEDYLRYKTPSEATIVALRPSKSPS